ncbi:MAG: hypothetical protein Q4D20_01695, partial [Clostridia bacterium]|nr:hypothetical protein [Clostridia bacterium]
DEGTTIILTVNKISEVKTIKLSAVKFVYDGKVKKPSLTVKTADGKTLKAGKDYAVSGTTVSNKIGIYSAKLSFKGNYKGSRTLVWKIIPQAPKNVKSVSTHNSITLTWNKVEGAFAYVICDDMGIKVAAVKTNKAVIKGLCEGERATYYIIATAKSGKQTVLGEKTKISTAAKPSTIEYVKAAAKKNQVTVSWYENHGVSGYQVSFSAKKNGTYKTLKTVKANPKKDLNRVTLSNFSKGTSYFKVRSYIKIGSNIIYGNWSAPVAVKIK